MYFWGEKMLSNLFRTLLDSNPQPSDRQSLAEPISACREMSYMAFFKPKRDLQVIDK